MKTVHKDDFFGSEGEIFEIFLLVRCIPPSHEKNYILRPWQLSLPRSSLPIESGPYLHGIVRVKGRHFFPSET